MKQDKIDKPPLEFSLDEGGCLTLNAPHGKMHISREAVSDDSRVALSRFVQSLSEVSSMKEVALGDVLVAAESCTIILRDDALPTFIRRGQKIDDIRTIERLLLEGRRLLRESPFASQISETEALRDAILDERYKGQAALTVLLRRASNAAVANAANA